MAVTGVLPCLLLIKLLPEKLNYADEEKNIVNTSNSNVIGLFQKYY